MKYKLFASHFLLWLIVGCCLFAFTSDAPRSRYVIPLAAVSIASADLDLDGDMDIVTGHNYHSLTHWSGISIIENSGNGNFFLKDSLFFYGGQTVLAGQLDSLPNPEIVFRKWQTNQQIGIIYNNIMSDTFFINVNSNNSLSEIILGDINNDDRADITFCSNAGRFFGVFYNFGYQNFTAIQKYSIPDYPPLDIACGDLNNDGRDDVVICGQYLEVYISTTTGFQKTFVDNQAFKDKVAIEDFDLDGWKDIIADNGSVVNAVWTNVYQNLGNGTFSKLDDHFFLPGASAFQVADFNNDTLPDIAYLDQTSIGDTNSGIHIVYNQGNFQISDPQYTEIENLGEAQRNFHSADLDGNGYTDFAVVRGMGIPMKNLELLFNDGYGHFGPDPVVNIIKHPKIKQQLCCYPNPFREAATFSYTINKPSRVELLIYTINGQLLSSLVNTNQTAGEYNCTWNNPTPGTGTCLACLKVNGKITDCLKIIRN